MSVSVEDRERIYEEELERIRARDNHPAKSVHKSVTQTQGGSIVFLLGVLAVSIWLISFLPRHWEYNVIAPSDEQLSYELRKAGDDGWEVVSARRAVDGDRSQSGGSSTARYEMILKRKRLL